MDSGKLVGRLLGLSYHGALLCGESSGFAYILVKMGLVWISHFDISHIWTISAHTASMYPLPMS